MGILIHARHVRPNNKLRRFSDRVAALDFKVHGCKLRAVAVYVPHAGYADELLEATYDQLRAALTQARRAQLRTIVGADFNTSLGVGADFNTPTEPDWYHTMLTMLPKSIDLTHTGN